MLIINPRGSQRNKVDKQNPEQKYKIPRLTNNSAVLQFLSRKKVAHEVQARCRITWKKKAYYNL